MAVCPSLSPFTAPDAGPSARCQRGPPPVMPHGARRHPTSGHLLTLSCAGCGESLCSQTQEVHHHTCWAEWSFSSCLAHDRPCSYKHTSGEASCAAANDTRSLKVVEMNECDEPSSWLLSSSPCCRRLCCLHLCTGRRGSRWRTGLVPLQVPFTAVPAAPPGPHHLAG